MKRTISSRLFFTVLWRGVCQVFGFIGRLFGYKDGCAYSKVLWRISATCLTALLVLFTGALLHAFVNKMVVPKWISPSLNPEWECTYISNHVIFQTDSRNNDTRVYNKKTGEVTLEDVDWIVQSNDHDSLAVFSKGGKRGYLNRFTGKVAIPADYSRAWVFSEGLAAVEKDGRLLFIDHSGQTLIDGGFEVHPDMPGYAFHGGYCLLKSPVDGNVGLIDRTGTWKLRPEYLDISRSDSLWVVEAADGRKAVLDGSLNVILPFSQADFSIDGNAVTATLADHTVRKYDLRGNLTEPFLIWNVEQMTYETGELHYPASGDGEDGQAEDGTSCCPVNIQATARCRRYQAECGWYGLMSPDGQVMTPPAYSDITAIGEDLYLCEDANGNGFLINGKGEKL